MKIYTPEECKEWIGYRPYYGFAENQYMFQPEINGLKRAFSADCLNLSGKLFHHSINLIESVIDHIKNTYPQSIEVFDEMNIYLVPVPHKSVCNAHMSGHEDMYLYPRSTQIPSFMTEYIVSHEVGHAIQAYYCPDRRNNDLWREYLTIRNAPKGICHISDRYDNEKDEWIYEDIEDFYCLNGSAEQKPKNWDEKPIEWFAEDFRYIMNYGWDQRWELTTIDKPSKAIYDFILGLKDKYKY